MKLLFAENLSYRLVGDLADAHPGSVQVRDVGLRGAEDRQLWDYAAEHGFLIASKDTDFYQRSVVFGAPPKVIWLRIGNAPTGVIAELLKQRSATIHRFNEDLEATFLPLWAE